jgi:hypothetical protein
MSFLEACACTAIPAVMVHATQTRSEQILSMGGMVAVASNVPVITV